MRNRACLALAAATLLLLPGAPALAQGSGAVEKLQERFEKKSKKDFIKNVAWELDYDKARKTAAESGKLIFAYFTRSYAP